MSSSVSSAGSGWDGSAIHDELDPQQLAAVTAPRGPVCVLAGAGTGKTRTITHRIASLVGSGHVAASQVLAVTFTARAAGQLRTRLAALGVYEAQARTFHSAALRQLRYFWPRVVGDGQWQLLDSKARAVGQAARRVGLATETELLRDLATEIDWSKAMLVSPDGYPATAGKLARATPAPAEKVAKVYAAYEELKTSNRVLDFSDLLLHTTAALEEHSAVAEEFRDRYRCFVVDEYQDITPLQHRLLDAWLGGRDDLTVVGDANQTIYSFAGASSKPLLEFSRRYPHATMVRLECDYRSSPQVVELANTLIETSRGRPAGARLRLRGQRDNGPLPGFVEYDDEPAEAAGVAQRIAELLDSGVAASEIAVLYRVNAQSEVYEQALAERDISYLVRGGQRFFERTEIRQAISALRTAGDGGEFLMAVRRALARVGYVDTPPEGGAARERWDALRALLQLAEQFAAAAPAGVAVSLSRFVAELDERAAAQHPPTVEGVTLASLHAAKGLEWDAVFLVGLVDGTLPIQHACADDEAIEEERRLFYVGVTRARKHLTLSWALARTPGKGRGRRASRFLRGLMPQGTQSARGQRQVPSPTSGTTRCRICGAAVTATMDIKLGRCAGCPADVDEDLLGRLQKWRQRRAGELKVPGFVVFTDATLRAIAEQRPADDAELVSISGIGANKLERFGAEVLAVVHGHGPQ